MRSLMLPVSRNLVFILFLFLAAPAGFAQQQWSMGYYTGSNGVGPGAILPPDAIEWAGLTHVIYTGANVLADGTLDLTSYDIPTKAPVLISSAHANGVKVTLGLVQCDWCRGASSTALQNAVSGNLSTLVSNIMSVVNSYGFDGLDVNWEPYDRDTQSTLMFELLSALRTALGTKVLTATAYTSDSDSWAGGIGYLDRLNIMTYDLASPSYGHMPYSWFNAALYGDPRGGAATYSVNDSISQYLALYPASKIGLGIPFYGWAWTNVSTPRQTVGWSSARGTQYYYHDLGTAGFNVNSYTWDSSAQIPWLYQNNLWVSFDNAQSVAAKVTYAKSKGLGGWIIWELDADYFPTQTPAEPLLDAIATAMGPTPLVQLIPSALSFNAYVTGPNASNQTVTIYNNGSGTLTWTAAVTSGSWLNVSSTSGSVASLSNAALSISVNISGLSSGVYTGSIQVEAPGAKGSPQTIAVTLNLAPPPAFSLSPSSLSFTAYQGGASPGHLTLNISNSGGGTLQWTATISSITGGNWLTISPSSGSQSQALNASVNISGLNPQTYTATILLAAPNSGVSPVTIPVTLNLTPAPGTPVVGLNGIANGASFSFTSASLAPGSIAAVFGLNLSDGTVCIPPSCGPTFDSNGRVIPTLASAQVTLNGFAVPILSTPGNTQLNVQIPVELAGVSSATIQVTVNGLSSAASTVSLSPFSPGLVSVDSSGAGQGAILNDRDAQEGAPSLVAPAGSGPNAHPATAGDIIEIYGTGLGAVTPPVPTGALPQGLPQTLANPIVTIGGIPATVLFSGLASCCVGLNQVNVSVPYGIAPSNTVPVVLNIGGVTSNTVTISVD